MAKEVIHNIRIVTDTKGLNNLIASLAKTKAKMEAQIISASIGVVFHAVEHGDCTMATKLVRALGEKGKTGVRTDAVMKWLEKFGAMRWAETESGSQFVVHKKDMEALRSQVEADRAKVLLDLQKTTPWALKPLPEYEGFEFMKELEKLIAKGKKKMISEKEHKKAEEAGVELNFDGMKEAEKLFAELSYAKGPKSNVETRVH